VNSGLLDLAGLRRDFPVFDRKVHGKPLVYLDSAATTQRPTPVLRAMMHFYRNHDANLHRSVHTLAQEAETVVDAARAKVAGFVGAPGPESLVFTRNATESINLVARGWGGRFLRPGDEILATELEHHSNLLPWQAIAGEKGAVLRLVPVDSEGRVTVEAARRVITPKTRIFAFTALSNALGTVLPVKGLIDLARENGAITVVDGAQWVPHRPTDVLDWGCDFLAFSAHKMLGPTGIGALYGKPELLDAMDPFLYGGDMIREVWADRATFDKAPAKFEAGTMNTGGAVGFGAAVDYLSAAGWDAIEEQDRSLLARAQEIVDGEPGVIRYGPREPGAAAAVLSFNVGDIHPHDAGQVFDMEGIAVRVGHHCCQPLMRRLGVGGTARASFYLYNTLDDVEAFGEALRKVKRFFRI